jgi:hypothetical protein
MIVVVHQTIGVASPALLENFVAEQFQEMPAVGLVLKDCLLLVSTSRDVIEGTGAFKTELASHAVARRDSAVQRQAIPPPLSGELGRDILGVGDTIDVGIGHVRTAIRIVIGNGARTGALDDGREALCIVVRDGSGMQSSDRSVNVCHANLLFLKSNHLTIERQVFGVGPLSRRIVVWNGLGNLRHRTFVRFDLHVKLE